MTNATEGESTALTDSESTRPGHDSDVLAWMLLAMGVLAMAPCIIIPEWRAYEAMFRAEQVEEHRLAEVKEWIARERAALEAIQTDPEVVARLAQRELNFARPNAEEVSVSLDGGEDHGSLRLPFTDRVQPSVATSNGVAEELRIGKPELPGPLRRVISWLPDFDYVAVFCDPSLRSAILLMSVTILGVGLWLPGAARRQITEPATDDPR